MQTLPRAVVLAAGGVIRRSDGDGEYVLVVHREDRGDWTLPKGKLEEGESWKEAALREVREESGLEPEPGAFAGTVSYLTEDGPKLVLFWEMEALDDVDHASREADHLPRWVEPARALELLDYEGERRLVARSFGLTAVDLTPLPEGDGGRGLRRFWHLFVPSRSRRERLAGEIRRFTADLRELAAGTSGRSSSEGAWTASASSLAEGAQQALEAGRLDAGWRLLHAARRAELEGLARLRPSRFEARVRALRTEAASKLASWRGEAVDVLLAEGEGGVFDGGVPAERRAGTAREAALVRDEHFANVYRKVGLVREHVSWLLLTAVSCLFFWFWLFQPGLGPLDELRAGAPPGPTADSLAADSVAERTPTLPPTGGPPPESPPGSALAGGADTAATRAAGGGSNGGSDERAGHLLGSLLLFGAMGGAVSGIFALARGTGERRIPELHTSLMFTLARPAIGAVAAVVVYAALVAGMFGIEPGSTALLLVVAFAAGFSDRLLERAVRSASGGAGD